MQGPHWVDCPKVRTTCTKYLLTVNELYATACTIIIQSPGTWHTNKQVETLLGAVAGPVTDFTRNRFTWAAPTPKFERDLPETLLAIDQSGLPARVATLCTIEIPNNNYSRTKITNIATFEAGTLLITQPRPCCPTHPSEDERLNTIRLHLVVIENTIAPPYNIQSIKTEITAGMTNEQREKVKWHLEPPEIQYSDTPVHHTRDAINLNSSLIWYRRDYVADTDKEHTKTENYNRLLGALGILPPTLKWDLWKLGHDIDKLSQENMEKISKIIRNTSLEAYKRSEYWKYRKRKYRTTAPT